MCSCGKKAKVSTEKTTVVIENGVKKICTTANNRTVCEEVKQ